MVGLFVVIAVCRLGAGSSQPPDGVVRGHQAREAVTSHARERYTRIPPRSTSLSSFAQHQDSGMDQQRWQAQLSGRRLT
ncbi:unnamed protein product [Pieris macdunnoughi]|uniref:Secreted protein n=1 Tax=Pieris macdunnoughi TaxID=345717 RepID=A0A821PJ72_9NEOP|nr:unnamed protein product [Pieris macdunnoughi]